MKNIILVISIVFLSLLLVATAYILKNEQLCCNYELCRQLTDICIQEDEEMPKNVLLSAKGTSIYLENLDSGDVIEVGTEIKGSVIGSWYWEGVFSVVVLDRQGDEIDVLLAQAQSDSYTDEEVPFSLILDIDIEEESVVVLRFEKSNPSDMEENRDYAQMSVTVKPQQKEKETISVKIFFPNNSIDATRSDCSLVFPISRDIEETVAVGRASLNELFEGNTEEELENGYFTDIPEGVKIQNLTISEGIARVDLSKELEIGVGGSCRVTGIRAQIEETLKQFSTVDSVVISIDGRTEDILQP